MFLQDRIPACDVLPGQDSATILANAEEMAWLGSALAIVARAKKSGDGITADLENRVINRAHDLHAWLGRVLGAESELPLVEAIDLLCRRNGSGGVSAKSSC